MDAPRPARHVLTVTAGPDKGLSLELPATGPVLVLIGRCFEALPVGLSHMEPHRMSLVFSDLTVSARHAVLLRAGTGLPLCAYDLGSRNGTMLRSATLPQCLSFVGEGHKALGRTLRSGDELWLAESSNVLYTSIDLPFSARAGYPPAVTKHCALALEGGGVCTFKTPVASANDALHVQKAHAHLGLKYHAKAKQYRDKDNALVVPWTFSNAKGEACDVYGKSPSQAKIDALVLEEELKGREMQLRVQAAIAAERAKATSMGHSTALAAGPCAEHMHTLEVRNVAQLNKRKRDEGGAPNADLDSKLAAAKARVTFTATAVTAANSALADAIAFRKAREGK